MSLTAANISAGTAGIDITGNAATVTNGVYTSRTINTTAPITGGGDLSGDRTFAIPAATSLVDGYLTAADWTTFNNKGTVSSVALALPGSVFTVSGSPVTGAGTLTGTFATQAANSVFAGPTSGGVAVPSFRGLVVADIPDLSGTYLVDADIGVSIQAYAANLATIAALSSADGNFIVGSAGVWVVESGPIARNSIGLGIGDSPTFTGLNLSGMTALRLLATDGSKNLLSTSLINWLTGTTNRVSVSDDGDGTVTFTTPQDSHTTAQPTFEAQNNSSGLDIHSMTLATGVSVTIPADYQAVVFGDYVIDGTLTIIGELRVET